MQMDILLEYLSKKRHWKNMHWKQPILYHVSAFGELDI